MSRVTKVADLIGPELDYAVALAERMHPELWAHGNGVICMARDIPADMLGAGGMYLPWCPSVNHPQTRAIVQREGLDVYCVRSTPRLWHAYRPNKADERGEMPISEGATEFEAALRAWARYRLGEHIDIPEVA